MPETEANLGKGVSRTSSETVDNFAHFRQLVHEEMSELEFLEAIDQLLLTPEDKIVLGNNATKKVKHALFALTVFPVSPAIFEIDAFSAVCARGGEDQLLPDKEIKTLKRICVDLGYLADIEYSPPYEIEYNDDEWLKEQEGKWLSINNLELLDILSKLGETID